jgi:hypothetical protein
MPHGFLSRIAEKENQAIRSAESAEQQSPGRKPWGLGGIEIKP